jgi:hypothetical protein
LSDYPSGARIELRVDENAAPKNWLVPLVRLLRRMRDRDRQREHPPADQAEAAPRAS